MSPYSFSLIKTLALIFSSAIIGGLIAKKFKLPLLIGYIMLGIIFGALFSFSIDKGFLYLIADIGATLLLFTLGLEFSSHRFAKIIQNVALIAIMQILVSFGAFFIVFHLLGFSFIESVYLGAAASLSSTIVIVKIFSERGQLETIQAEVLSGFLIIQDLAVIPLMVLLPSLSIAKSISSVSFFVILGVISLSCIKASIVLGVIIILGRYVLPIILDKVSKVKNREIFLFTIIGIVFAVSLFSYVLGLSAPLGAFIAGLLIADTSQNHAIFSEIRPLRDLFAVVFFVSIGLMLPISIILSKIVLLVITAFGIMILKAIFVYALCRYSGYHKKIAFFVGLGLTSMSEFGFVIAREGMMLHVLSEEIYAMLIALTFFTIFVSTPIIANSDNIYYMLKKKLGKYWPNIFHDKDESTLEEKFRIEDHIVICGHGRVGSYIARALEMEKIQFLVIDINHKVISDLQKRGIPVLYGDPADREVLKHAQVEEAKYLIIAIPDFHTQKMIISHVQTLNRRIRIICRTHYEEDQAVLKSFGVDIIVQPEFEAALSIVERLLADFGVSPEKVSGKISRLKIEHGLG